MQLRTEHLTVEIAAVLTEYQGTRFDATGFITQVTLDGRHTFCGQEAAAPGVESSGGVGLCNEFGIFTPVGYADAAVGEAFPKLGVGNLQRPDAEPYSFMRTYPGTRYRIDVERQGDAAVTYQVHPLACRGYAVAYRKTIQAEGRQLTVQYTVTNVGDKTLVTEEYNHNFLAINGQPISDEYRMRFSFTPVFDPLPAWVAQHGESITWPASPETAFYGRINAVPPGAWCEVQHQPSGAVLRITGDHPIAMIAVWGVGHVVSPELFYTLDLPPRATATWSRRYTFSGGNE